ncbi:J domain-containing protein [Paenarthrobacter sp. NyZ202]|uniref:J domain-containing protein n=1 Tax=Paenarthrobacter sp. NyZ202 TaxID=3402689 RepID=UPI003CE6FACE
MSKQPDYYALLNVAPDASARDISRAYRSLLRRLHPDTRLNHDAGYVTGGADGQELHAIMQAYVVLSNPEKRAAYDRARRGQPVPGKGTPVKVRVHRRDAGTQPDVPRPEAPRGETRRGEAGHAEPARGGPGGEPGRGQPPFIAGPTRWAPPSRSQQRTPRSYR